MFRVVYTSQLDPSVGRAEVEAIIQQARARNAQAGVTGVWLMRGRDCLSALEGPPDQVRDTAERIWDDKRHSDFRIRDMRPTMRRKFPSSALRFMDVDEAVLDTLESDAALRWLCDFAAGPAAFIAEGVPAEPDQED